MCISRFSQPAGTCLMNSLKIAGLVTNSRRHRSTWPDAGYDELRLLGDRTFDAAYQGIIFVDYRGRRPQVNGPCARRVAGITDGAHLGGGIARELETIAGE